MPGPLLTKTIEKAATEGNDAAYVDAIRDYGLVLESKKLPVIFTTHHLAQLIGMPHGEIDKMIQANHSYYKTYTLRKKSSGFRFITAPNQQLKYVQRWLLINILEKIEPHPAAHGFRKQNSIGQNAAKHINKELLLNIDCYRFFDSINERRVFGLFCWMGYSKNVSWDISKLLTVSLPKKYWAEIIKEDIFDERYISSAHQVLPQGAPTSPALSNLIAFRMDTILGQLAHQHGCSYSRYADDLTFSGKRLSIPPLSLLKNVIKAQGFYVNEQKVHFYPRKNRQTVTGITVNEKISVSRKWKNELRNELYYCLTYGVLDHLRKTSITKDNYKDHLFGKVCYLSSIEPLTGKRYFAMFNEIEWPI